MAFKASCPPRIRYWSGSWGLRVRIWVVSCFTAEAPADRWHAWTVTCFRNESAGPSCSILTWKRPRPLLGCVSLPRFLFRPDYRDPPHLFPPHIPLLFLLPVSRGGAGRDLDPPPEPPPWLHRGRSWQSGTASASALSKNISPSHPGPSWPFHSSLSYCSVCFCPACALPHWTSWLKRTPRWPSLTPWFDFSAMK